VRYAFIKDHMQEHSVRLMCKMLDVHPSGFYAWCANPLSARSKENQAITSQIKQCWLESGAVYGYRKIHDDLRHLGIACGQQRVWRLMKAQGLRSQAGYRRRPNSKPGEASAAAPNVLDRKFEVATPNDSWVVDITYIKTHEGWLYLATVLDLFSRAVIGWSMQSRIDRELVISALLMAIWRRQPKGKVLLHSDQGCQFTSSDWQDFLEANNFTISMSRRGNCYDNAVVESFFQLLKRERVKRKIYATREEARTDIFDYIEMFYNSVRRHGHNNGLSPAQFEKRFSVRQVGV
jgi:putative transposase